MTLVPDRHSLAHQVDQLAHRLTAVTQRLIERGRHRLTLAARHVLFRQPAQLAQQARRRLDDNARRLQRALPQRLSPARRQLRDVQTRWLQLLPRRLQPAKEKTQRLQAQLHTAMPRRAQQSRQRLDAAIKHLEAVSPYNVLKRGYSYTLDENGALIKTTNHTYSGQRITTVLHDGRIQSRVEQHNTSNTPRHKSKKDNPPANQTHLFD